MQCGNELFDSVCNDQRDKTSYVDMVISECFRNERILANERNLYVCIKNTIGHSWLSMNAEQEIEMMQT